jgi:hypothetical protein
MQVIRQRVATVRWHWAGLVLCLLFAFDTILHVAHAMPAQAHASASEIVALSDGSAPCEPGRAAGDHYPPTNGCPLCAPVGTAFAVSAGARARPPIAAGTLVPGLVVNPHFHPPRLSLHA